MKKCQLPRQKLSTSRPKPIPSPSISGSLQRLAARDKGRGKCEYLCPPLLQYAKQSSQMGLSAFPLNPTHQGGKPVILPQVRDPRFITVRRGGTLLDSSHRLLALWASDCAEHVLQLFEEAKPADTRPRQAIDQARAWVRGEITMSVARKAAFDANAAARDLSGAARFAAYAAAQAAAVAHVAAHELGAAAYAIKAVRSAAPDRDRERLGRAECQWQRERLPEGIRDLVLDDQSLRNGICWSVFDC
jgi:hypothetical protein